MIHEGILCTRVNGSLQRHRSCLPAHSRVNRSIVCVCPPQVTSLHQIPYEVEKEINKLEVGLKFPYDDTGLRWLA